MRSRNMQEYVQKKYIYPPFLINQRIFAEKYKRYHSTGNCESKTNLNSDFYVLVYRLKRLSIF